ncbi:hypothetical protein KUCAC02_007106, partial [Chaenocephalus aceratus]
MLKASRERSIIERGLTSFHDVSCIGFVRRTSQRDFLNIHCYSYVGRRGYSQTVSLDRQGCLYHSTVQHEQLHALGFNHEQCRSDRDQHIRILWENIQSGWAYAFDKINTLNLNTPYDYNSVMQYHSQTGRLQSVSLTCTGSDECVQGKNALSLPRPRDKQQLGGGSGTPPSCERSIIERGLTSFHDVSCIGFVRRTSQRDFLNIHCYSYVGRRGYSQTVSLDRQVCLYHSTVQHELLHALGFNHEQCRSDRDQHIRILWENIQSGWAYAFDKINTLNLNTPYDYNSVMQYH